ncbi:SDR family NAD(P)-dependent oxidoreductase [Nonomuraea sp. 3N208]|uniref:SDR family NAD(P)-dependent oxidoreductase n=1 Tax=Nonomuraea sp. 3N208 TaxID=3457421 RepID=UPI003FD4CAB4
MLRLHGKVALITGGGTGIGAATARKFVAEGAHVVIMGRREKPLRSIADEIGAVVAIGDASQTLDARRAVETATGHFGGLDIIVANAGGHDVGAALDVDDAAWQATISANLTSAFTIVREGLRELIPRQGNVLLVSSIAGLAAAPEVVGYVTTKHALVGLTRSIARDYGRVGVRANCLCPGWIRTEMSDVQMDQLAGQRQITREDAYGVVTRDVPLRRAGRPEEIATICAFLCSDEASMITGAVIAADAGAGAVDLPTIAFDRTTENLELPHD